MAAEVGRGSPPPPSFSAFRADAVLQAECSGGVIAAQNASERAFRSSGWLLRRCSACRHERCHGSLPAFTDAFTGRDWRQPSASRLTSMSIAPPPGLRLRAPSRPAPQRPCHARCQAPAGAAVTSRAVPAPRSSSGEKCGGAPSGIEPGEWGTCGRQWF